MSGLPEYPKRPGVDEGHAAWLRYYRELSIADRTRLERVLGSIKNYLCLPTYTSTSLRDTIAECTPPSSPPSVDGIAEVGNINENPQYLEAEAMRKHGAKLNEASGPVAGGGGHLDLHPELRIQLAVAARTRRDEYIRAALTGLLATGRAPNECPYVAVQCADQSIAEADRVGDTAPGRADKVKP